MGTTTTTTTDTETTRVTKDIKMITAKTTGGDTITATQVTWLYRDGRRKNYYQYKEPVREERKASPAFEQKAQVGGPSDETELINTDRPLEEGNNGLTEREPEPSTEPLAETAPLPKEKSGSGSDTHSETPSNSKAVKVSAYVPAQESKTKFYVGRIQMDTTEEQLREAFSMYSRVIQFRPGLRREDNQEILLRHSPERHLLLLRRDVDQPRPDGDLGPLRG